MDVKPKQPRFTDTPEVFEYAKAIADYTFWTDTRWDHNRLKDRCRYFFGAYRYLREYGYTHDVIWSEIKIGLDQPNITERVKKNKKRYLALEDDRFIFNINKQVDNYKKKREQAVAPITS